MEASQLSHKKFISMKVSSFFLTNTNKVGRLLVNVKADDGRLSDDGILGVSRVLNAV